MKKIRSLGKKSGKNKKRKVPPRRKKESQEEFELEALMNSIQRIDVSELQVEFSVFARPPGPYGSTMPITCSAAHISGTEMLCCM